MDIALNAAGGLALFMLAMAMMTDGLKTFGGHNLKVLLRDWTSNPLRGVLSGALVTALVQSSSAVTVATIGFVNAGVLSLQQALAVIFGANVGTTMTGWLVSLVGFGFKIEAFALPVLAAGVGMRLLAPGKRLQGLGNALAGFGLFFLGLAILKDAFSSLAGELGAYSVDGASGFFSLLSYMAFGFVATLLTQSSSAAIAIILTAASESVIGIDIAAAAIIGANVGTTSTALFAVIGATANAKRVATGHLAFNVVTGLIALLMLPAVLAGISTFGSWTGMGDQPAPLLALFHTAFNMLGVVLLLPLTPWMARRLDRLFRSEEEDLSRPQHLDKTVLAAPAMAIDALRSELSRLSGIVSGLALTALSGADLKLLALQRRSEAVFALGRAIGEFATSIRMEILPRDVAEDLPRALRVARYLEEAARLTPDAGALRAEAGTLRHAGTKSAIDDALEKAAQVVRLVAAKDDAALRAALPGALAAFQGAYQDAKNALLHAAATHVLTVERSDMLLDALSHARRMVEQIAKAGQMLGSITLFDEAEEGAVTDAA